MLSDPCFYGQLVRQGLPSLNLEFATVAALNSVLCFEFLGLTLKHHGRQSLVLLCTGMPMQLNVVHINTNKTPGSN